MLNPQRDEILAVAPTGVLEEFKSAVECRGKCISGVISIDKNGHNKWS